MGKKYDFSGWATRNDLQCSDGRIIKRNAFIENDGKTVPLVWNHQHNDPLNVLGHALLENRDEGVYAYCSFNDTDAGQNVKNLVQHGDITALSIYANQLKHNGREVVHGAIREVSLVLAGANPGAFIDSIISHGELTDEEAFISFIEENSTIELEHAEKEMEDKKEMAEEKKPAENSERTVGDVYNELTEEQKTLMYAMVAAALEEKNSGKNTNEKNTNEKDDSNMKHGNVFENEFTNDEVLSHSDMEEIFSDAKRYGSLKDSVLAHGITNIDYLFPDEKTIGAPDVIARDMTWVAKVMNGVHHTPFSRVRSLAANVTADEARARGFTKGNQKVDEVLVALRRTTTPCTVYKHQSLDRDDIVDITDFDVVAWLKSEMRMMLDEEIARAILIGDGRDALSDDKINESNIRPIWKDNSTYTIVKTFTPGANDHADDKAKAFIRTAVKARKDYRGSGTPVLFTTEDVLTDCLLMEDLNGRIIYDTVEKLATALRVSSIVTVPVMEGQTRTVDHSGTNKTHTLLGIIVNLNDYNVGADKGGAVSMFDDFDIDYNKQKYLIETRCSGALIKPYSAIVIESVSD